MLVKTRIKQSFASASASYDSVAVLQRNVGSRLLRHVDPIDQSCAVLDLGCGTGFITHELLRQKICAPNQILALDIAEPMLHITRNKLQNSSEVAYVCGDAEHLPLASQSVDLVIANLSLQWCTNLEQTFSGIKRILKPSGRFAFTTFGPDTLLELKNAWLEVDDYTHVNTFHDVKQLVGFLQQAGFQQYELETRDYLSTYNSAWDLMAELKHLGAHTVLTGGNKRFTSRAAMQRMVNAYQKQAENGLIPATFAVITAVIKV